MAYGKVTVGGCAVFALFGASLGWAASPAPAFTFDSLVQLIESKDLRSIEEVLPQLPTDLLTNYTLMRKSRSLQPATDEAPRVILFGEDASLVIAYSGLASDPSPRPRDRDATQKLEVIQYHRPERAFEMRAITFAKDGSKPVVSERNPTLCLSCHRQDPRPNWEQYSGWPGAIGGLDDVLQADERPLLVALVQRAKSDPRFRPLVGLEDGYASGMDASSGRTRVMHNILMTGKLARWNFQRAARLMKQTPYYAQYRYAILASFFCSTESGFLPPRVAAHHSLPIDSSIEESSAAGLAYLFDSRGIPTNDWYMGFDRHNHMFVTPGLHGPEFAAAILEDNPELLPDFTFEDADAKYHFGYAYDWETLKDCEAYRAKSLKALENVP